MKNKLLITAISFISLISACKDNTVSPSDPPSNEGELITTLEVLMTDTSDGSVQKFVFRDKDGEGGNAPERFDTIRLKPNSTYLCELLYLDESKSDVDTVSNEIAEEANDHLIYFNTTSSNTNIELLDKDGNGLPLGLQSKWKTGAATAGTVEIVLKHQPGIKDGSKEKGETDAAVKFELRVE